MGEQTQIAWTDATFNPWIGCNKVSQGCKNCYASVDTFARTKRAHGLELWGANAARHRTSEANWKKPLAWNRDAAARGVKIKVFCASLADVFEAREDLDPWREDLWNLIESTPNLIWQLLTKRPEEILKRIPASWRNGLPSNVWVGTTVEDQDAADRRIPALVKVPAKVRFLSCEPLLGEIDLRIDLDGTTNRFGLLTCPTCRGFGCVRRSNSIDANGNPDESHCPSCSFGAAIEWIILGGESGPKARACDVAWIESIKFQAQQISIATFVKQLGAKPYHSLEAGRDSDPHPGGPAADPDCQIKIKDPKGGNMDEWGDPDFWSRQFPRVSP